MRGYHARTAAASAANAAPGGYYDHRGSNPNTNRGANLVDRTVREAQSRAHLTAEEVANEAIAVELAAEAVKLQLATSSQRGNPSQRASVLSLGACCVV